MAIKASDEPACSDELTRVEVCLFIVDPETETICEYPRSDDGLGVGKWEARRTKDAIPDRQLTALRFSHPFKIFFLFA
jgi:hypothetical protein